MIENLLRFGPVPRNCVGVSKRGPNFSILIQFERALKLGDRFRQSSFLFISAAQEERVEPESWIKLLGAKQLLDRRVPLSCENQNRSDHEVRQGRERSGLQRSLAFRDGLVLSPHRRQEPG